MQFRPRAHRRGGGARWLAALTVVILARTLHAEAVHLVREGDTLGAIALRYGVSEQALREANKLSDEGLIRLGQKLVIPDGERSPANGTTGSPARAEAARKKGVIRLVRGTETLRVVVRKRPSPSALSEVSRMLRPPTGEAHRIDARLVSLLATVSDHFEGRDIVVVSGFRPYLPTQYTPHSNHNAGRAIDFMVRGISNEAVRDYCRTLHNVGVGYYPNSSFVHMDVRSASAYWVDYAGSGQKPRYHRSDPPPVDPDEGAGEVPMDLASLVPATSSGAPAPMPASHSGTGGSALTSKRQYLSSGNQTKKSQLSDSTGEARIFPGRD